MEEFLKAKQKELDDQIERLVSQKVLIDTLIDEYNATRKEEESAVEEVTPAYGV